MAEYECQGITEVVIKTPAGQPDRSAYQASYLRPDGRMHHHVFPTHTIEARAIEYDLDPVADFDAVLDIVLHEPFIDEDDDDDPAEAEGYKTTIRGFETKATLWTAETIQDAREAQQLRVDKVKETRATMVVPEPIKDWLRQKVEQSQAPVVAKGEVLRGLVSMTVPRTELAGLREAVAAERRRVRGRDDGTPLKG